MAAQYEEPRVFQPGDVFRDHHVVESFLGAGASGQVYVIRHRFTGDRFALKVGHLKDRGDARQVARSLVEAQATYRLRHRNVVRVIDLACEADGMVWQIMELLQGLTVAGLLDRYGKLSPLYAIDIVVQAAFGLQAAHEQQVVHRDVQPSNLFLTMDGQVKLLDFSLAKVIPSGLESSQGRPAMGTRGYMPLEQQRNDPATAQFDVYALGVTLWQMLTGRPPFQSPTDGVVAVARNQLRGAPSLVEAAGLPAYCDEVLRRATAADPAQRYTGMWPLAQALGALRDRLEADPAAAAAVRHPPAWESQLPVVRDPEGWNKYGPPRSLPRGEPSPSVPSRRVVVPVARGETARPPAARVSPTLPDTDPEERRSSGVVAKTVRMAGVPSSTYEPPTRPSLPPTVRRPQPQRATAPVPAGSMAAPPSRRWLWLALVAALVVGVVALGLGLGVTGVSLDAAPTPATPRPGG